MSLDIDTRAALPAEWLVLLQRHPRADWGDHPNLGMTARFWLDRHGAFRQLGRELQKRAEGFQGGGVSPEEFQTWFAPRLQMLLGELNGHHQVEDFHYFPVFRRAAPELDAGFELLDRDHKTLHQDLVETAETANALIQALARQPENAEGPTAAYAKTSARLLRRMERHLDDEEDLVIPLFLDRGEAALAL